MAEGSSNTVVKGLGLMVVAAAGGAVALLGAWLFGSFDDRTSTVHQVLVETATPPPANVAVTKAPMSIGQIYKRDAPGVVQITAKIYTQARDPIFGTPEGFATAEK